MKSLREYIEIVNEDNPLRPGRTDREGNPITYPTPQQQPQQQPLPTVGDAIKTSVDQISNAFTPTPPDSANKLATSQRNATAQQQNTANQIVGGTPTPTGVVVPAKGAATYDPLAQLKDPGIYTTADAKQAINTPVSAAGTPSQQAAKKTAPRGTGAAKPAFKDLGAQYGYNSPEEVQVIQQQLVKMGYPIAVDGKFGPQTQAAYKKAYSQMYGQQPGNQPTQQPAEPPLGQTAAYPPVTSTAPVQPKTTDPNSPFYIPPNPAVEKYKAQQAAKGGVIEYNESIELDRIKSLINYK